MLTVPHYDPKRSDSYNPFRSPAIARLRLTEDPERRKRLHTDNMQKSYSKCRINNQVGSVWVLLKVLVRWLCYINLVLPLKKDFQETENLYVRLLLAAPISFYISILD